MIVQLTKHNLFEYLSLARMMFQEGRYSHLTFCEEMYVNYIRQLLKKPDFRGFLYLDQNSCVGGALLGYVSFFEFAEEQRCSDLLFYVRPDLRGSRAAFRLEEAYAKWAEEKRIDKRNIYLSQSNGYHKAEAFFEKLGYERVASMYCKEKD